MPQRTTLPTDGSITTAGLASPGDTTHYVPTANPTGSVRFRTSLCGVDCAEGRLDHEAETHGRGSSTLAYVDCAECQRLAALAARAV